MGSKKKRRLFGILVLVSGLLCSCGGNQNPQKPAGTLDPIIVGVDKFEPYTYLDMDGNFTGVDIDLATIAFHKLGYEPKFEVIPWNEKNALLADGSIDCIWSCYSMNGREDDYQWAGPYLYSRQVIAVCSDSDIQTFDDLADKKVGVQATTRAASLFLHTTESALPHVKRVNCFATTADMFAAMRKDYVDAISGHEALINELIKHGNGMYRLLEESPHVSKAGVAFQKGTHQELAEKLSVVIRELTEDGTIGTIAAQYGLDADKVVVEEDTDEK